MSFLKDPDLQASETLLRTYGKFLRSYKKNLSDRVISTKSENCENLFKLKFGEDTEIVSVYELLQSDNKILNKILMVFFHLGKEAKRLDNAAGLLFFATKCDVLFVIFLFSRSCHEIVDC